MPDIPPQPPGPYAQRPGPLEMARMAQACPRCGAAAGEPCIDVRMHRARKMLDPAFRAMEKKRSARRPLTKDR
jgi:hypothetical protein